MGNVPPDWWNPSRLGSMIELRQLRTFRAVALTSSFTRAAAELGYSQSSVTIHIKALERELGAALFERKRFSKSITLTEVGRKTLECACKLLALVEEIRITAAEERINC